MSKVLELDVNNIENRERQIAEAQARVTSTVPEDSTGISSLFVSGEEEGRAILDTQVRTVVEHVIEGADGFDTLKGESAYEVAVRNGFVGTEKEWLESLRGVQGYRGETMTYSFSVGPDGHLYVTEDVLNREENEKFTSERV